MNQHDLDLLRYPVGKYLKPQGYSHDVSSQHIGVVEQYPALLKQEVAGLTVEELQWKYRPEGWNIRQVVHHTADSHMNAFVRFKLALTESMPTIKPYHENLWAQLPDSTETSIEASIKILEGLHFRWSTLLRSLSKEDFQKKYFHPEQKKEVSLFEVLALYSWHCNHHLAHVQQAKKYKGTF